MRKSIIAAMLASLVFLAAFTPPALASPLHNAVFTVGQTTYVADGLAKQMDGAPFLQQPEDRVFVPVRYLGYALGLTDSGITWDQANQMAILSLGNTTIVLTPKEKTYYLNGQAKQMDVLPLLKSGRLYLPARYVAEAFGYSVSWDQATKSVVIGPAQTNSSSSSGSTQSYNLQIVPVPSSAQAGQSVQLDITVTDTNNQPASGVTVYLTSTSTTAQLSPAVVVTNTSGQGVVTATDSYAESVTFTATVPNSYATANTTVQWSGTPNQSSTHLQIVPIPSSAQAGQSVQLDIAVANSNNQPVSGVTVYLTSTSTTAQLSLAVVVTNASGQGVVTATDSYAESVTFTATVPNSTATANTTVQWSGTTNQSSTQTGNYYLSLSSSTNSATAAQPVVFTVTVENNAGSPVSSTGVIIGASSTQAVLSATTLVTNTQGQAFFTATDNTAETVTFSASPSSGGSAQTASVRWSAPPSSPSYTSYSTTPSLQISSTASTATLGQPVAYAITATGSNGPAAASTLVVTANSSTAQMSSTILTTNNAGRAFFTATDNVAESVTFTVRMASNTSVMATATTQWLNSYAQPSNVSNNAPVYLLEMSPSPSPADAMVGQPVVLTMNVVDNYYQPAAGIGISLISSSGSARLSSTYVTTNSQGKAYVTITDYAAENITITGSLANVESRLPYVKSYAAWSNHTAAGSNGYTINNGVAVSGYYATLSESTSNPQPGEPVVLAVTITNDNDQPVSGQNVLVSSTSSNVQLTAVSSVTNSQGQIYVIAVDNTTESATFSVYLKTNGTYGSPVSVGTLQWD